MSDDRPPQAGTELQVIEDASAAQKALDIMSKGDLSKLGQAERATFLANMAQSLGLNPLTRPVDLIANDKGNLIIYWNKGATDQLRAKHNVNLEIIDRSQPTPNTYAVTVRATLPNGRQDEEVGVVVLSPNMAPADQANSIMKASTKAKRRATLSILGLGLLDESEMDTIPLFQQQLNQPRTLSAPAQTVTVIQPKPVVQEAAIVPPEGSQEPESGLVEQAVRTVIETPAGPVKPPAPRPAAVAVPTAVAKPSAHVMPGRRLPVAPPVVIK